MHLLHRLIDVGQAVEGGFIPYCVSLAISTTNCACKSHVALAAIRVSCMRG